MRRGIVVLLGLSAVLGFPALGADRAPVAATGGHASPLVSAARSRDAGRVAELLTAMPHADVNERSVDGTTALHWAVYNDDAALVERLLAAGADPNVRNDYGSMPLAEAAVVGNVGILRRLLKAHADVESANPDGQTALMILARTSNVDAARLLIKAGANVNAREKWRGQTALMWAAAQAQPEMVRLLVKHGAKVNERSYLTDVERQVTAEPRMQQRPPGGFTPLLYAARAGCAECARELIRGGADVNLADPDGITPLVMAGLNFSFDTAAILIKAGADVDTWDTWGRSPLYAVVETHAAGHVGGWVVPPPPQAPWSTQTLAVPGVSPCVHHWAFQVWPLYDTSAPPVYAVVDTHAAALHVPVEVDGFGELVVGGTLVGGVAPAKRAVYFVNSHAVCGTLLQVPDVVLWFGSAHWRSRVTDQYVYRARWCEVA